MLFMNALAHKLGIVITDNLQSTPPVANFYVEPPLLEEEKQDILESQGPRSILAELLTYPDTEDPNAVFGTSGVENEFSLVMAEELAKAVMSVRALAKAQITHNGSVREVLA
jgi:hypothetical protein